MIILLRRLLPGFTATVATFLIICVLSFGAWAQIGAAAHTNSSELGKVFGERYSEILVDARGSRGGNGDIAAAYLTLSDWFENYQLQSRVTVLVDDAGLRRFRTLAEGNVALLSRVRLRTEADGVILKPFDLYLVLASPTGAYRYEKDFGHLFSLKANGTRIVQTVLGNTENQNSLQRNAIVEHAGRIFEWGAAGLAKQESGVYSDLVARKLRPLSINQIRTEVLSSLSQVSDKFSREVIRAVVQGNALAGAKVGLVYGISMEQTRSQFLNYLRGLVGESSAAAGESFVLLTPSEFRADNLHDEELKKRVRFISSLDQLPTKAEAGHVYIVETKTLPHKTFVSLMALSMKGKVIPVGAGDGFLSAALEIGEPFVLTQVAWNRANAAHLKDLLLEIAVEYQISSSDLVELRRLLDANFSTLDFRNASRLSKFAPVFRLLNTRIPYLSDRLMEVGLVASTLRDRSKTPAIDDFTLQQSVLEGGRPGATETFGGTRLCQALFN